MNEIPNGVAIDPRSEERKALDYQHIGGAVNVNWVEKTSFKKYTQRNQDGSLSCGEQAAAKAIECLMGKVISATPYFWRKNYPVGGMFLQDIGDVNYNRYTCLESVSPSQNQDEPTMNIIHPLTTNIGITGYKILTQPNNLDQIAEAIEQYKQCIILLGSNGEEYTSYPVFNGQPTTFDHYVTGVDYGLVDGVKVIAIEDSAGQWSSADGCRKFTSSFIANRVYGGIYFLGAKDVSVPQDQKFMFNIDMAYGQTSNDIKELQKRLGVIQTGFYGTLTAKAVVKYQLANGIKLTFWQRYV